MKTMTQKDTTDIRFSNVSSHKLFRITSEDIDIKPMIFGDEIVTEIIKTYNLKDDVYETLKQMELITNSIKKPKEKPKKKTKKKSNKLSKKESKIIDEFCDDMSYIIWAFVICVVIVALMLLAIN